MSYHVRTVNLQQFRPGLWTAAMLPARGRRGLGEYCNEFGCWNFDAAKGAYVNAEGKTEAEVRAPAPSSTQPGYTPPSTQYGSTVYAGGGASYDSGQNTLLMQGVTGQSLMGGTQALNNANFATRAAADSFAASLGGEVVRDPNSVSDWNQTAWAIRLPDGTTVNAGAIASILGNAAYGNTNVQSGEIARLFGASYQPGIAESLLSGGRVNLTAGPPAPGYLPTPLSASYKPAGGAPIVTSSNSAAGAPGGNKGAGSGAGAGSSGAGPGSSGGSGSGNGAASSSGFPLWGWAVVGVIGLVVLKGGK